MPVYQAVILGLVQGITEFLPISSTAHLILVPWVLGWRDPGLTFDVALHVGTLLAVVVYFARTWVRLAAMALRGTNPRLLWFLAAATAPGALAGLALESWVETTLRSPYVIAAMMIGVAGLIWWAEKTARMTKDLGQVTLGDAMTVGVAQAVAIIPGTSRSGITMAAAMWRGVERSASARFSFLLSTPIIAGATLKAGWNIAAAGGLPPELGPAVAAGILASAISGFAVIAFLVKYLQAATFKVFIYYRVICGIIILLLAIFFRDPVVVL